MGNRGLNTRRREFGKAASRPRRRRISAPEAGGAGAARGEKICLAFATPALQYGWSQVELSVWELSEISFSDDFDPIDAMNVTEALGRPTTKKLRNSDGH